MSKQFTRMHRWFNDEGAVWGGYCSILHLCRGEMGLGQARVQCLAPDSVCKPLVSTDQPDHSTAGLRPSLLRPLMNGDRVSSNRNTLPSVFSQPPSAHLVHSPPRPALIELIIARCECVCVGHTHCKNWYMGPWNPIKWWFFIIIFYIMYG